jgi:hypothetical protein
MRENDLIPEEDFERHKIAAEEHFAAVRKHFVSDPVSATHIAEAHAHATLALAIATGYGLGN